MCVCVCVRVCVYVCVFVWVITFSLFFGKGPGGRGGEILPYIFTFLAVLGIVFSIYLYLAFSIRLVLCGSESEK